jgi:predicted O-methyltransferase YrrM
LSQDIEAILANLASGSHRAGTFMIDVLQALVKVLPKGPITTLETGCGKSTVVFSNIAAKHWCFAYDDRKLSDSSVLLVQESPDFKADRTEWVYGPTQKTIPTHKFPEGQTFDVILIDGPHGYPFPDLEYAFLYPLLKEGSILIIDDIHIPNIGHMYDLLRSDRMYDEIGVFASTGVLRRTGVEGVPPDGDHWWEQHYNVVNFPRSMAKYAVDRSVTLGAAIDFADPAMVAKHARRGIEHVPQAADGAASVSGARTIDIGSVFGFKPPEGGPDTIAVTIAYQSLRPGVEDGAMINVGATSYPLPRHEVMASKTFVFPVEPGKEIILTLLHPNATAEHERGLARYEFRRHGALVSSITLAATSAPVPASGSGGGVVGAAVRSIKKLWS